MTRIFFFILLLVFSTVKTFCQDSLPSNSHPIKTFKLNWSFHSPEMALYYEPEKMATITGINNQATSLYVLEEILTSFKPFSAYYNQLQNKFSFPYSLSLSKVQFQRPVLYSNEYTTLKKSVNFEFSKMLSIDSCQFYSTCDLTNVTMKGSAQVIEISNTKAQWFSLNNISTGILALQNITNGPVLISRSRMERLSLGKISKAINSTLPVDVGIYRTTIDDIFLSQDSLVLDFLNDSLKRRFLILKFAPTNDTMTIPSIAFKECYLNVNIFHQGYLHVKKLVFNRCTFGPDAKIENFNCDTLIFKECGTLPATLSINPLRQKSKLNLFIFNTDLSQTRFNYYDNMVLFFNYAEDTSKIQIDQDDISNTYESLLDKFRNEKKENSYQTLDIQYRIWKANKEGFLSKSAHFINKVWWYYGYKKWYVLLWTLAFIVLFFIINMIWWKNVHLTYAIVPFTGTSARKSRFIPILLYTLFVFFSLKIDFAKLKFSKSSFILLFFLEYLIGLICIFFIFNAIIKL